MQLELPELTDLNTYINAERTNRYNAAKIKNNMTTTVAWMAKAQLKPIQKVESITFIWHHTNKRKDFDNVEFSQKFIRDGLVEAHIIQNDNWTCLPPKTTHLHDIRPDKPGVTVIIE